MNSILVTTPVSVTGLLSSNSTLKPWCATTGEANSNAEESTRAEKNVLRMNFLQEQFTKPFICSWLLRVKVCRGAGRDPCTSFRLDVKAWRQIRSTEIIQKR